MTENKKNDKRQKLLIFMCWLMYTASYVSRYSYNANVVAIKDFYSVTNSVTGLVGSCFFFAYGLGQIINGLFCKKYNKKFFLAGALLVSGAVNFYLFTCPPINTYKYAWLLNGCGLSVLWSSLLLTLSENLDEKHLTTAMVIMSSTVPAGTVITYGASALFNLGGGFKYSFLLGGLMVSAVAVVWLFVCDKLTAKQEKKGEVEAEINTVNKKKASGLVLASLIIFGVFMAICNFVKDGLNAWVPQILKDTYGFGDSLSIVLTLVLPVVGLFGSMTVVALAKAVKNDVAVNLILFAASAACIIGVMFLIRTDAYVLVIALFGAVSLFAHAINSFLTSFVPLKMRDEFNSGFLAGVLNGCGYAGSTLSMYTLGTIADNGGWDGAFSLLAGLSAAAVALAAVFTILGRKKTALK